jgi:hypothetical protein
MKKFFPILLLTLLAACATDTPKKEKVVKPQVEVPTFNADSAYHFVEKQVSFGPRVISSKGWESCGDYLFNTLKKYTPYVQEQNTPLTTYDGKKHTLRNIIAEFSPEKNNRILLCAHWDTRHLADHDTENTDQPILGANDGGSGVGVLLEVARQLSLQNSSIGVDIILFDAEDYGQPESSLSTPQQHTWCLGSQYWSNNPHKEDYYAHYGILLDMVGAPNAVFTHEAVSKHFAGSTLKKVWKTANDLGYGDYFQYQMTPQIIDDHYYINNLAHIPTIDIIEHDSEMPSGFNKHWHTHSDNMQNISKETLNSVGQTLLAIIYND